ncbi:MAG: hypothetical protein QM731_26010 [Chitinophagaceae bacterium]
MNAIDYSKHIENLCGFIMTVLLRRIEQKKRWITDRVVVLESLYGKVIIRLMQRRFTQIVRDAEHETDVKKIICRQVKDVWSDYYKTLIRRNPYINSFNKHFSADNYVIDPWQSVEAKDLWKRLRRFLTIEDEQILIQYIVEKLTFKEIAEKMGNGVKANTLCVRYNRLIKRLKTKGSSNEQYENER